MPLTAVQLQVLRTARSATGNRLGLALELADLTQARVAEDLNLTQPYVSDVSRGRHATITVENAHKFAAYFGCAIEDLFPAREGVA